MISLIAACKVHSSSRLHVRCFSASLQSSALLSSLPTAQGAAGSSSAVASSGGAAAQGGHKQRAPREARPPAPPVAQTPGERAATRIQAAFRGYAVRKVIKVYKIGGVVSEMLYAPALGFPPPRAGPSPFGRINTSMTVAGNVLWLYGGMVEIGDREVAFDDLW